MAKGLLVFLAHLILTGASLYVRQAGVTAQSVQARRYSIIGGKPSSIEHHPYQVSLITDDYVFCHGVIVDKQWVLTLASWVSLLPELKFRNSLVTIRAGSNFSSHDGTIYNAKEAYVHPLFNMYSHHYDFALVKIYDHFKFNEHCKKIAIGRKHLKNGTEVTVSGWGQPAARSKENEMPVQEADMTVMGNKKCQDLYVSDVVSMSMMCAFKPNVAPCIGDYGDPAVHDNKLHGLYSWAEGCTELPAVFSNVPVARNWIRSIIQKH